MTLILRRLAGSSLRTPLAPLASSTPFRTGIARSALIVPSSRSASSTSDMPRSEEPLDLKVLKRQAIKLYKELHRLGRDYPDPNYKFNERMRRAFEKNAKTTDPILLKKQLELGEHIKKEVLALVSLKKFRHLRRAYYPNDGPR